MDKLNKPIPIIILIIGLILLVMSLFFINYLIQIIPTDYKHTSPKQLENSNIIKESFRNNRYRTRRNRLRPSRRRWWGDYWGYRYSPPTTPLIYNYSWYNPWVWFSPICKRGCTQTSIGKWGCLYPGYSANDCIFASDCIGC